MKDSKNTKNLKVKALALEMLKKTEGGLNRIDIGIGQTLGMIGTGHDQIKF
ncbi:hypothetical protein [Zobellia russellii]|uniref:hypothetical protein n=1 Tax=Zobellia russellii TaxID=248907 RepID=UPI0037DC756D